MADDYWVAWEPPKWVEARGESEVLESAHFAVRWGTAGNSSARASRAAPQLLLWLERCWAAFCDPSSDSFFVTPYTTAHWCDDGLRRKVNVYIGDTGLGTYPSCGGWAHQGTWVEPNVTCVWHAAANPQANLHHSYLALAPGAAEAERTVCHEFGHCLQMHTGGHLDANTVGYQWEAHAEYCVRLLRPCDPGWAPHLPVFLRTAHLPVDSTNYDDGEAAEGGRQYIVWPFYSFLDKVLGPRTAHSLWHADRRQRQTSGHSLDMVSNLLATPSLCEASTVCHLLHQTGASSTLGAIFGAFARASLTLSDLSPSANQAAALLAAADPLDPARFTPLRELPASSVPRANATSSTLGVEANSAAAGDVGDEHPGILWWAPDGSRPLRRCGFATHRLRAQGCDGRANVIIRGLASTAPFECELVAAVVGFDPEAGIECAHSEQAYATASMDGDGGVGSLSFATRAGIEYLLSVCAAPKRDMDWTPLPWGINPRTLPSFTYTIGMSGCMPHPAVALSTLPEGVPLLTVGSDGWVAVPTGIGGLHPVPRLSGGGASIFAGRDVRSGNPGEVNLVLLSRANLAVGGRTLRAVRLSYRVVVGYSGVEGLPGPSFGLLLLDETPPRYRELLGCSRLCSHGQNARDGVCATSCEDDLEREQGLACVECAEQLEVPPDESVSYLLFSSPQFDARPYAWDSATGGSSTNYSPPINVDINCDVGPLRGARQTLQLVFQNGRRNIHLQGGGWPAGDCCDFGLQLRFDV